MSNNTGPSGDVSAGLGNKPRSGHRGQAFRQLRYPTSPENPVAEDVIAGVLAFHARQRGRDPRAPSAVGYRPESLRILFGQADS